MACELKFSALNVSQLRRYRFLKMIMIIDTSWLDKRVCQLLSLRVTLYIYLALLFNSLVNKSLLSALKLPLAMSDTFYNIHRDIILCHLVFGYANPTLPFGFYKTYHKYVAVYMFVMNVVSVLCTVAFVGGMFFAPGVTFEQICRSGVCTSALVYVTVIGLTVVGQREDFEQLSESAGRIYERCASDPLDTDGTFAEKFIYRFKMFRIITVYTIPFCFFAAASYVIPSYVQSSGGSVRLAFPLYLPFEFTRSPYLEAAFLVEVLGITITSCRMLATDFLLLSYLQLEIQFLRHLKYTLASVFTGPFYSEYRRHNHTRRVCPTVLLSQDSRLRHWAKLHRDVFL